MAKRAKQTPEQKAAAARERSRRQRQRPEVRARERERSAARKEERAAYRRTPRGKLLHCLRSAEGKLRKAGDPARRARLLELIRGYESELHRMEVATLVAEVKALRAAQAYAANRCEPSGFVTGTVQYVIRYDGKNGRVSFLDRDGGPVPEVAYARKFAGPADAVAYLDGEVFPRYPSGHNSRLKVVPERDTGRVVWPLAGG